MTALGASGEAAVSRADTVRTGWSVIRLLGGVRWGVNWGTACRSAPPGVKMGLTAKTVHRGNISKFTR